MAAAPHLVSSVDDLFRLEHDRDRLRRENEHLLTERNQLLGERTDLARRLDGARANVSRLNERRVTELFPDGPGRTRP